MDRKKITDPGKMIVQLTVGELDEIVTAAVTRALGDQPPGKTPVPTRAGSSDVEYEALMLAQRCREKAVPFHRLGHLIISLRKIWSRSC